MPHNFSFRHDGRYHRTYTRNAPPTHHQRNASPTHHQLYQIVLHQSKQISVVRQPEQLAPACWPQPKALSLSLYVKQTTTANISVRDDGFTW